MPISGTTLIHLLELAEAHRATHGSWLDDSSSESELNLDSGAGSETSSEPGEIPDLVPSIVADQRFTRYSDNVVLTGSNNDVSDFFRHVWIDNILIATRNPRPFMRRKDYLNEPGMLQTEIHFKLFDCNSTNRGGMEYCFLHLRVFVLVKEFLEGKSEELEVSFYS